MKIIKSCIQCKACGEEIESKFEHDFVRDLFLWEM